MQSALISSPVVRGSLSLHDAPIFCSHIELSGQSIAHKGVLSWQFGPSQVVFQFGVFWIQVHGYVMSSQDCDVLMVHAQNPPADDGHHVHHSPQSSGHDEAGTLIQLNWLGQALACQPGVLYTVNPHSHLEQNLAGSWTEGQLQLQIFQVIEQLLSVVLQSELAEHDNDQSC